MNESRRKNSKVSVVIPVYNAEKYLGQMLESVLAQTLHDIEIICVNDGSTDHSGDIIKKYMDQDSRISLLEQANINAGVARNRGLSKAKGKYVVFWDADDKFDKRVLELMFRRLQKKQADVCVCGVCEFTDDGKTYETDGYLKTSLLPKKDPFNRFDMHEAIFGFASNVVWNKMFRRKFLAEHKLCFQDIRQGNDTAFVMETMYRAQRITCIENYLAYYRMDNADSLTGKASETIFCPYESYMHTLQKLEGDPDFSLFKKSFYNKAARGMFRALNIQTSFDAYKELYLFLRQEGLEKLGLTGCRREDMEEEWMYTDLQRIRTLSAEDFLFFKATERMSDRDQLKYTLRRVRRRLALLLSLNQKLKKLKGFAGKR